MQESGHRLPREFFQREVTAVARDLLGRVLVAGPAGNQVAVRLTEVEAYAGQDDPASHAFRGRTPRTTVMFGPPGHLYTYFVYGMHWCANIVTGADGDASAVLLRAGEVVTGIELANKRRPHIVRQDLLARGPAALTSVLGLTGTDNGTDLCQAGGVLTIRQGDRPPMQIGEGPRVGVSVAADTPWRFWELGHPSVSAYRKGTRITRTARSAQPAAAQQQMPDGRRR